MKRNRPGISTYDTARLLGFSSGRVDGSVTRLQRQGEIGTEYVLREGRIAKELYPKGFAPDSQTELIVDRRLLDSPEVWSGRAFLYALDRMTLGVTPFESEEWRTKALVSEVTEVKRRGDSIVIRIPSRLLDFYIWKNSSWELSIAGSSVIVTIKTKIPIQPSE
jgi:hypothetical protein